MSALRSARDSEDEEELGSCNAGIGFNLVVPPGAPFTDLVNEFRLARFAGLPIITLRGPALPPSA